MVYGLIEICRDIKLTKFLISRNGTRNLNTGIDNIYFNDTKIRGETAKKTSHFRKEHLNSQRFHLTYIRHNRCVAKQHLTLLRS